MMSTSQRLTASTLMAAAAATVGIGLATSAPASADTNLIQHRTEHSLPAPKSPQRVRTDVVKIVKRIVSTLHAKPCPPSSPSPSPETPE